MKYYKLIYEYENDKKYVNCNFANIQGMDEYAVSSGNFISEWKPIVFEYSGDEGDIMTDYIANIFRWLIVSNKFLLLVNNMGFSAKFQFLPVKLRDVCSNIENEFYGVLNILDIVDAFDLEHSKYDVFELDNERIFLVEKYALRKGAVKGYDIFRLKNDTIPVFVSEKIKKIIEENQLLGFDFLEVDVY